ncbi:MAG: NUDIX hydrolase [Gemmatimonadota bacterium]
MAGYSGLDPARLSELLATPELKRIPDGAADRRAAVTLLLTPEPEIPESIEALFGLRAELEGDPWSGHVALPGGRKDPGDADLLDTARRELREETHIDLPRAACVGRLDELHPHSAHLPSIAITPFVAWLPERPDVRENYELAGHVWIPLSDLADPARRSTLERRTPEPRVFETIEYAGAVVWGLTLAIVEDFLGRIGAHAGTGSGPTVDPAESNGEER